MQLTKSSKPNSDALELKTEGKGVFSWTTRGQLGIEGGMVATTGFQKHHLDKAELMHTFSSAL